MDANESKIDTSCLLELFRKWVGECLCLMMKPLPPLNKQVSWATAHSQGAKIRSWTETPQRREIWDCVANDAIHRIGAVPAVDILTWTIRTTARRTVSHWGAIL